MLTGSLPARSNLATWRDDVEITDVEDGSLVDLTLADEIQVSIRDPGDTTALLVATLGDGVELTSAGVFQFVFTATQMATLCPSNYEVGCLISFTAGDTEQLILGTVPVVRGL